MKPNIVFYFSDQQRWDTLGCYGQKLNVTPNLDRLAKEGVRFENAFTVQPVCGPARSCLQTGKYPTETGCFTNGRPLRNCKTIAQYFNENGYETAYVGKWHLASEKGGESYIQNGVPPEFQGGYKDYWMASDLLEFTSHGYNGFVFDKERQKVSFTGYRADCINNFAIDYIHGVSGEKPFFLFISQIEPHHQNDHNRYEGPDGSKELFKNYETPGDLEGLPGDYAENYPDYLGACHSLDYNVGRLVDTLKEKGLWDNTILFYTSDHGSHFRTRNSEYKRACHEGCLRIPMIAVGPGFRGGKVISELVSLMDIPTTLLDCAGISKPVDFHGDSLKALVNGTEEEWKQEVFVQISESQVGRAIRTQRYKYSVRADEDGWKNSGSATYYEDFLYDLEADPYEHNNLADSSQHLETRAALAEVLKRRMQEAGEEVPVILPKSSAPWA